MKDNQFFTPAQREVVKKQFCKGLNEDQAEQFCIICERMQLDPFTRQIYARAQKTNVGSYDNPKWENALVVITSIDGLRSIAERSGEYRGQTKPEWYSEDDEKRAEWRDVFIPKRDQARRPLNLPEACRVGILRKDFPHPCYGYANFGSFAEYVKGDGGAKKLNSFWGRMPEHMIAKVAEAHGLRKAFPLLLGGIHIEEELGGTEADETTATLPVEKQESIGTPVKPVPLPSEKAKVTRNKPPVEQAGPPPTEQEENTPEPKAEQPKAKKEPESDPFDHAITTINNAKYKGRKISDLSLDELEYLNEKWATPHKDKIDKIPASAAERDLILACLKAAKAR